MKTVAAEMDAAAGKKKVLSCTTDRASANVLSWAKLKDADIKGVPDAVHVHHSIIGDFFKIFKVFEDASQQAYRVVEVFRQRAKVMSDWLDYQKECGGTPFSAQLQIWQPTTHYRSCCRLNSKKKLSQ